jgi:hypothetical protein
MGILRVTFCNNSESGLLYRWFGSAGIFFWEVKRPGRDFYHLPYLTQTLKIEYNYVITTLVAFKACSRVKFTLPLRM